MYLKRPVNDELNAESRIDRIIEKITAAGVKVYIIMYHEPKIALSIDSEFSQNVLEALSPHNVFIVRHPNFILPFMWSHHE